MAAGICDDRHGFYLNTGSTKEYPLVSLGETLDDAQAKARELIAVLDAFVNPWTTDGSVPNTNGLVELQLRDGRRVRSFFARGMWLRRDVLTRSSLAYDGAEVAAWRAIDHNGNPTTAPTGASEE